MRDIKITSINRLKKNQFIANQSRIISNNFINGFQLANSLSTHINSHLFFLGFMLSHITLLQQLLPSIKKGIILHLIK